MNYDRQYSKEINNKSERRGFERIPIDFSLGVYGEDVDGKKFEDKAVLKDVSGGGAKFLTQKSDIYFSGQLLKLTIFLPGTGDVEAHMKTKATVVRIDQPTDSEKENKNRRCCIAVRFDTRLIFERI